MAFIAGKDGAIEIPTGTAFALNKWTLDMQGDILDVTNFTSSGFKENIAGLKSAKITASGPYNNSAMALAVGTSYAMTLSLASVDFVVTARIASIQISADVTRPGEVSITAESTGSFTASIA